MQKRNNDERIREVRSLASAKRKKKLKVLLAVVFFFAALYAVANIKRFTLNFLRTTEAFAINNVIVFPLKARPLVTGFVEIERGKNLLFLDIESLREKILLIQEVKDCRIEKIYPGTLSISVVIRKPWAKATINGGKTVYVDRNGKVVYPIKEPYFVFAEILNLSLELDETAERDIWKINVLREIEESFNYHNLQKHLKPEKVYFASANEIRIIDGEKKVLIRSEGIRESFESLRVVLEECERNNREWKYIDARFENPYVQHSNR